MQIRTLIWLLYFVCAFTATHLPPSKLPSAPWLSDKVEHLVGFAVLGFVTYWRFGPWQSTGTTREHSESSGQRSGRKGLHRMHLLGAFLAVYALIDEATQPLVGRGCEALDWLADMAGATIGLFAGSICFRNRGIAR
jgi:hypothetical protein